MSSFLSKLRAQHPDMPRDIVTIKISNVARYLYEVSSQEEWIIDRDFPNLAPPFENMFFEWAPPTMINSEGRLIPQDNQHEINGRIHLLTRQGILVHAIRRKDEQPGWTLAIMACLMFDEAASILRESIVFLNVESDGSVDSSRTPDGKTKALRIMMTSEPNAESNHKVLRSMMNPAMLAISFMHCKNVTIVDHTPSPRIMRRNPTREVFKTLEIGPLQKILNMHGAQSNGIAKAMHLCRGHFKTYTTEAPLLGRAVGTFFWAQQVRGSRSAGVVHKNYDVRTE